MTNKSKAIGTRGETAVVKALRANGFPGAERRALAGSMDLGDILICPGVIGEVKWGKHARHASMGDIAWWWRETERERGHAGAAIGLLIVQRNGYGDSRADQSRTFIDLGPILHIEHFTVEVPLVKACELLRRNGWGDPL